jgi:hypothetical protein
MNIYVIYKKSDRSITAFVVEDDRDNWVFDENDTSALSSNTIDWTEEKTVNSDILIKTFEDVKDTVGSLLSVDSDGVLTEV